MDEKGSSNSFIITSEEKIDSFYSVFFGISCAFFAFGLLPESRKHDRRWSETKNATLKGSAYFLGLLIWKILKQDEKTGQHELLQKLENAQKQIEQLKKTRSEDGKANEKVVSIFSAREQSWFSEKKKLTQEIDALVEELQAMEIEKEKSISELNEKMKETDAVLLLKDKSIEQGEQKRHEVEENLKKTENLIHELRENSNRESQRHSNELLKHKTAFIELVSNQRQLEAEMGRALRQFEAAKRELDLVLHQKNQSVLMVQKLSMELVKSRKDLDQKDQILSALLGNSNLDTAEKEMLLKEAKLSKVVRKQAEMETARWKPKPERHSLRNMLSNRVIMKSDVFSGGTGVNPKADVLLLGPNLYLTGAADDELKMAANIELPDRSITCEADTYEFAIEQKRSNLEIDGFAKQLRLKDEKMEALRWHLLSKDIESKRLLAHIETLDLEVSRLRQENIRLEALKEQLVSQFNPQILQTLQFGPSRPPVDQETKTVWSKVKVIKRKPGQKRRETNEIPKEDCCWLGDNGKADEIRDDEVARDIVLTIDNRQKGRQEKKFSNSNSNHIREGSISSLDDAMNADTSIVANEKMNSGMKTDIQALGVSYKIKRLKQQFVMLERLAGKQESENGLLRIKGLYALTSLLNKQIDRYQSLQGKTDDLCQRVERNNLNSSRAGPTISKTGQETKLLEHFLGETFQLQRHVVATGQKLVEVQAKISSGFVEDGEKTEMPSGFDMKRFAENIQKLFQGVQRGLEIRISRIIGDLEGTLACDGIIHFKK